MTRPFDEMHVGKLVIEFGKQIRMLADQLDALHRITATTTMQVIACDFSRPGGAVGSVDFPVFRLHGEVRTSYVMNESGTHNYRRPCSFKR